jgi:hypothetical protein
MMPSTNHTPTQKTPAANRQCCAHFGDAEDEPEIHGGDDDGGKGQAAPAAGHQAEIPTRIVAGDDGADAERPQRGDAGIAAQAAPGKVICGDTVIGLLFGRHRAAASL